MVVAFVVGHVGATLLVAAGLAAALAAGLTSWSIVNVTDVGMSYGAVGVLGALTAAIPRRWRAAWTGWWLAVAFGSAASSAGDFTNVGHGVALVLGMVVGHPVRPPGALDDRAVRTARGRGVVRLPDHGQHRAVDPDDGDARRAGRAGWPPASPGGERSAGP